MPATSVRLLLAACAASLLALVLGAARPAAAAEATATGDAAACPALLRYTVNRLQDESPQPLCQYAGKVLLVVNTASYCGFTPQYEGLEAMSAKYASRGLVVLGFPSNDFGQQEPGDSRQIANFCFNTYGVKFPMFSKTKVVGKDMSPFFAALVQASGEAPRWNFHKYLIDREGRVVASFASKVTPSSRELVDAVDKALAAR